MFVQKWGCEGKEMDSIIVDVVIGLLLVGTTCTMAYLGVHVTIHPIAPEDHKERRKRKAQFIVCGLVIAAVTVLQIVRSGNAQRQLIKQIEELKRNPPKVEVTTPAVTVNPPTINFPTPQPQQAFVHPLLPLSGVNAYSLDKFITLNDACGNTGPTIAYGVDCKAGIYIVDMKPIGINGDPMVTRGEEQRVLKEHHKKMGKFHAANRTLGTGDATFETAYGPVLDVPLDTAIKGGTKTIFWAGEYSWKDGSGSHLFEHCMWLQTGWVIQKQTWHYCDSHNGLKY